MGKIVGISNITASEGNLRRFSRICWLRSKKGGDIIPLIKSETELTNEDVISRHIYVMVKLGLLMPKEEEYILASEGKALVRLMSDEWSAHERVFYFKALWKAAFPQLYCLLLTSEESEKQGKQEKLHIAVEYYKKALDISPIWPKAEMLKAISKLERGDKRSSYLSKFECMRRWLEQLNLLNKNLTLTELGSNLVEYLRSNPERTEEEVFSIASIYVNSKPNSLPFYCADLDTITFNSLFNEAYKLFENPFSKVSDLRAMSTYIWVKMLLDHHKVIRPSDFKQLIDKLVDDGVVKALLSDDYGKIAYIRVA